MKPNPRSRTSRLMLPLGIRVSLGTCVCPEGHEYQVSFHLLHRMIARIYGRAMKLIRVERLQTNTVVYKSGAEAGAGARPLTAARYFTFTVITEQAPGIVSCRSSPSCRASLCLPGVSWESNTSLPSPKCTHDGVPLTIV